MANIKTIQIAFNMDDQNQAKLYNFYKDQGKNASLFGKMLIQKEMDRMNSLVDVPIKKTKVEEYLEEIKVNTGGLKLIGGK